MVSPRAFTTLVVMAVAGWSSWSWVDRVAKKKKEKKKNVKEQIQGGGFFEEHMNRPRITCDPSICHGEVVSDCRHLKLHHCQSSLGDYQLVKSRGRQIHRGRG